MNITDEELLQKIWANQLRLLSTEVLHNYMGGGVGLCTDDKTWFEFSSGEHIRSRHRVTDAIRPQQLLARLRKLAKNEHIEFPRELTFFINNELAVEAFKFARQFWLDNGVPEGMEDGKMRTARVDVSNLSKRCENMLIEKFASSANKL